MLAQLVARLHERNADEGGTEDEDGPLIITEDCAVSILKNAVQIPPALEELTCYWNRPCKYKH